MNFLPFESVPIAIGRNSLQIWRGYDPGVLAWAIDGIVGRNGLQIWSHVLKHSSFAL